MALQAIQYGSVSFLKAPLSLPAGNADTITKSLEPFHKGQGRNVVYAAASTGFLTYSEPSCGGGIGGPGAGAQLEQLGLVTGVKAGLSAIPVVGNALASLAGLITSPLQHHKLAVQKEQATLCRAVPEANNFLRGIDAAVAQRQMDTATAVQVMEQGYQNWLPSIAGIIQERGNTCNEACIQRKAFRAAIEKRKQDYALIDAQNASGAQGLLHGVVDAFNGVVSSVGAALSPSGGSGSALVEAGLTPARQSSLAMTIMVGGLLVVGVLWFQFIRGAKK